MYPSRILHFNRDKPQSRVAVAFSTKDRTELSLKTIQPLSETAGIDLYWMDGSTTEPGQELPERLSGYLDCLREIHLGVVGGPDVAIVYAIDYLLSKDYEFVGLIENDVLLQPDWLDRTLGLFAEGAADGLRVGAVSARTIRERALVRHRDYAVMFNLGAGMIMLSREAARVLLRRYRTTHSQEIREIVRARTGIDLASVPRASLGSSADFFYDVSLLLEGYCSLAPVPSMGDNIDAPLSNWGCSLASCSQDVPEDPAILEQIKRLQGSRFESVPAQVAYRSAGSRIVYPHQVITSIPASLNEHWDLVWRQGFGPFAFKSRNKLGELRIPILGAPTAVMLETGPNAGSVELELGTQKQCFSLQRPDKQILLLRTEAQSLAAPVILRAQNPGVVWLGVQLLDDWTSLPWTRCFDFGVLRPRVESTLTHPVEAIATGRGPSSGQSR